MKKSILIGITALLNLFPNNIEAKDPVVMTINGKDIKSSEFEYLYNKNKQQQLEEQSFDKYVEMFVTYKLKVADAESAGIDTTATFLSEFNGYRNDLAAPYLIDKSVNERLAQEAYQRMQEDVDVSHIMLYLDDPVTHSITKQEAFADSIRKCLVNGEDFETLALKYSIDPQVKRNKGRMGFVRSGILPYSFEYAAYNTPVGGISDVVKTQYGMHIIKVNGRRAAKGEVLVQHIMKLFPRGASEEAKLQTKAKVDSIYNVVMAGGDFSDIAIRESEDPGSAKKGGELPWFGTGKMVPQFEAESFRLGIGEISKPIETVYGYHIIKKLDAKGIDSYENLKDKIQEGFYADERKDLAKIEKLNQFKKQYNFEVINKGKNELLAKLEKNGAYDSTFLESLKTSSIELFKFADRKICVSDLAKKLKYYDNMSLIAAKGYISRSIEALGNEKMTEYVKDQLEETNPEFANLVNEYRDGLLLFEISNRNVWEKAGRDKEGLEKYFQSNKDKYVWNAPKYKGFVIQTINDSVANDIKALLPTLGTDTLISSLKKIHKQNLKIERVLVSAGENQLVDACIFNNTPDFKNPNEKFPIYFVYGGKLISAPEKATDVRGQVTVDYQNALEEQWVEDLKRKYKVKINKKELEKVK